MAKAQIIQFPKQDIIFACQKCGNLSFVLHFDNLLESSTLIAFAECAGCGHETPFIDEDEVVNA